MMNLDDSFTKKIHSAASHFASELTQLYVKLEDCPAGNLVLLALNEFSSLREMD